MSTAPFDGEGRKVSKGQQAVAASSEGVLATFTAKDDEVLLPMVGATAKSVAFLVCWGPSTIPADEEVRFCLRKTTTPQEWQLAYANGLEPTTLRWGVIAMSDA